MLHFGVRRKICLDYTAKKHIGNLLWDIYDGGKSSTLTTWLDTQRG